MYGLLNNLEMRACCKTAEVLEHLRKNRVDHSKIVGEARAGFLDKATAMVAERLGQLREGRIVSLAFDLQLPADHTRDYDTVIQLLEMHTEDEIELSPAEVRMFVQDQWEWSEQFIATNAFYSGTAAARRR